MFEKLYLDYGYLNLLENYCIKNNIIDKDLTGSNLSKNKLSELSDVRMTGIKKLFILLTLYEQIDSSTTIYDFSKLIDYNIINEDANMFKHSFEDDLLIRAENDEKIFSCLTTTFELMELYKGVHKRG